MSYSEAELIRICKKQDPNGQRLLYSKYAPMMMGICIRYAKDKALASDILQDAFVKIFNRITEFKSEGSLEGWMRRIAVNTALDFLRRQKHMSFRNQITIDDKNDIGADDNLEDEQNIIHQLLDAGFTKNYLLDLLNSLPDNYSSVFNLFYIDELSHKEISDLLQINEATSRKWVFRAKDLVRKALLDFLDQKLKGENYEARR